MKKTMSAKFNRAFTLIEIVVVIGIMGVLTTIIYSSFDGSKAQSRDQKRVSDISAIQLALELHFNQNGYYPSDLNTLTQKIENKGPYINEIPKTPLGSDISYENTYIPLTKVSGEGTYCTSYHLWTKFERNNSYLDIKKGFDSINFPEKIYECGNSPDRIKVNASAEENKLVYDVMP